MKVCDAHPERKAIDSIHIEGDGSRIDICDECKYAVMSLLSQPPPELGESPIAPPSGEAQMKAPKGAFSFLGLRK